VFHTRLAEKLEADIRLGIRRHRGPNADDLKSMRRDGSSWAAANKADDDGQIIPELASWLRNGASRCIGFAIGKELTKCGRCSRNKPGRIPVVIMESSHENKSILSENGASFKQWYLLAIALFYLFL
jgi:hypothetical protein